MHFVSWIVWLGIGGIALIVSLWAIGFLVEATREYRKARSAEDLMGLVATEEEQRTLADERAKLVEYFPFLKYSRSPVRVPLHEHVRRALFLNRHPLLKFLRPTLRVLRDTPRVLVCMPFDLPEPELMFCFVVHPLIERVFGGRCIRVPKPVTESESESWKQKVIIELLHSHIVIFDLSYSSRNVALEMAYYGLFVEFSRQKRHEIRVCHSQHVGLVEKIGTDCITYDCEPRALRTCAEELKVRVTKALREIGFQEGTIDPWVLYGVSKAEEIRPNR